MGGRIGVFVATMTGLAEICAEEAIASLAAAGFDAELHLMDGLEAATLDNFTTIVIISSTYGHGDIPDNGQAFYEAVEALDTLADKSFAVFALGDRTYADTFCHAGEKWYDLFLGKGATPITPLERHDASAGTLAEDEAAAWAARWATNLKLAA